MRELNVYVNSRKAGVLTELNPGKGYTFKYDPDYLSSDAPSISVSLSKRNAFYESSSLFPFFANILPEGVNRKVICRMHRIDEHDLFGILVAMAGRDFIGGVHIKTMVK